MLLQKNDKGFLLSQIQEIKRYLQQYPNENQNDVVMQWIEKHSKNYRLGVVRHFGIPHLCSKISDFNNLVNTISILRSEDE